MEDVVSHLDRQNGRRFLVRCKGFGPSYDEWKSEKDVSERLVKEYDELCRLARGDGSQAVTSTKRRAVVLPIRGEGTRESRADAQKRERTERAGNGRRPLLSRGGVRGWPHASSWACHGGTDR